MPATRSAQLSLLTQQIGHENGAALQGKTCVIHPIARISRL
jgi:hypothetical protein